MRRLMVSTAMIMFGLWPAGIALRAAEDLPQPIWWRQNAFVIPFNVAPATSPDQQPAQINLYVSNNQGARWEIAQTVSPQSKQFELRNYPDGEYWFFISTVDRQGRVSPATATKPEMRVIIDTAAPRLEFSAVRGDSGEIKANWQAVDPNLKADSLKIEYQMPDGTWRPVAIDRPADGSDRMTTRGTLTWWPNDAPGALTVRASLGDRAGNVAMSQAKVDPAGRPASDNIVNHSHTGNALTPLHTGTPSRTHADTYPISAGTRPQPDPYANPATGPAMQPYAGQFGASPTQPYTQPNTQPPLQPNTQPNFGANSSAPNVGYIGVTGADGNVVDPSRTATPGAMPWPSNHRSDAPLNRDTPTAPSATSPGPGSTWNNNPSTGAAPHNDTTHHSGGWPTALAPPDDGRFPAGGMASTLNPAIRDQVGSGFTSTRGPSSSSTPSGFPPANSMDAPTEGGLPPGERPRMVNSRSFEIDYEVDAIGPSGIAKVELWGSRDNGRTWSSYGVDNDNRSPIRVNVEGEGLYGFRIAVQSGSGLGGQPPRSGDRPELWVGVDMTKPDVRLTTAEAGVGEHAGELTIRWEATDCDLSRRPITLLFSDKPGGPWSIMAAGLENVGQYSWRPDNRAPDAIYLRIEARDEAGNIAVFEAANPVPLESVRPEGRLRGVRPVNEAAGGGQLYRVFR